MIKFIINEATFYMEESDLAALIYMAVPDYLRDSTIPAPDDTSDLIRGAIKSTMALIGNKLMFSIYGKNAPVLKRKEDKLPVMWQAMSDWIIAQIQHRDITIQAVEIGQPDEASYQIVAFAADAIHATAEATVQRGETASTAEPTYTG